VVVVDVSSSAHWWRVRDSSDQEGFVSPKHLQLLPVTEPEPEAFAAESVSGSGVVGGEAAAPVLHAALPVRFVVCILHRQRGSFREGCLNRASHPFYAGCRPLNYSGNPGVNVSYGEGWL
jgi:hypothetical protein